LFPYLYTSSWPGATIERPSLDHYLSPEAYCRAHDQQNSRRFWNEYTSYLVSFREAQRVSVYGITRGVSGQEYIFEGQERSHCA
jgi:hypothetical protein